jgi:hypothetical protein
LFPVIQPYPRARASARGHAPFPAPARGAWALLLALAAACTGDGIGPGAGGRPGIHLVTRLPESDTVGALLPTLAIEVRDAQGKPAAGTTVQLEALSVPRACDPACGPAPGMFFVQPEGGYSWLVTLTTDAEGTARAQGVLGTVAGTARMVMRAAPSGYTDTVSVTVRPGATASVRLSPADTAVQVGRGYTLRAVALDRYGNVAGTPAATLSTFSADVSLQGMQVTGVSFGRAQIQGTIGGMTATAHVSVVPAGTLAATRAYWNAPPATVLMALDGSGRTVLMVYDAPDRPDRIYGYHLSTATTQTLLDVVNHPRVRQAASPRYSPDGAWVWFSGYESSTGNSLLWRMRPDGAGLELITPQEPRAVNAAYPFPSPDGTRVVYSGRRTWEEDLYGLYLLNVATGVHTPVTGGGTSHPRWSPTAEWISLSGSSTGRIYLVRPDGSGFAELPGVSGWISEWSPDGRWLLVQGTQDRWSVVEAATGESVPLPPAIFEGMVRAVWRPVP